MPSTTVNNLPNTVLALTTTDQLSAFYTSPYYSSFSDLVKNTLTELTNGQTVTTGGGTTGSDSNLIKFDFACLISSILMGLIFIKF